MTVSGVGVATGSYRFPVLRIDDAFREPSGATAVEPHPRIMIRSFALTFAAVTLRLQLPFLLADGSTYVEASRIVSWSCWIPNILFAKWWLRRKSARPSPRF